ncbi:MAG: L-histidine N(alpha)-methyltransferase [Cyanobacteria bacterium P01_E01_bin.34]
MTCTQSSPCTPIHSDRLLIHSIVASEISQESARRDARAGLSASPKSLPPYFFYDDRGSQLFEHICQLPEYYPTRTEAAILKDYAADIVELTGACELVELGSGSSVKTRLLLNAYEAADYPLRYLPIDVSAGILEHSANELLQSYPTLRIHALASTYDRGLESLPATELPNRVIAFIGSSLGNLSPERCHSFLTSIVTALQPGEFFLLGIDLHKDTAILEAAYDDRQGVTAAFNLNMLRHLNHRFGGNFNLDCFRHHSFYNENERQIEIYLKSLVSQSVTLKDLDLTVTFEAGELMMTEISRKFDLTQMQQHLCEIGLTPVRAWTDTNDYFGLVLAQR